MRYIAKDENSVGACLGHCQTSKMELFLKKNLYKIYKIYKSIQMPQKYVVRCVIWYHMYNLKNVKNTHGGVVLSVKLQALLQVSTLLRVTLLHWCFSRFLNCTNGTKSRKASQIFTKNLIHRCLTVKHIQTSRKQFADELFECV